MIITFLVGGFFKLVGLLFSFINIPKMPSVMSVNLKYVVDYIKSGVGVLCNFIEPNLLTLLIPFVIVIINFEYIYDFILWIIRKLPFGMK